MNFKAAHGKVERRSLFSGNFIKSKSKGGKHIQNITCYFALICNCFAIFPSVIESFTVSLVLVLLIRLFGVSFCRNSIQAEQGFSWEESQGLLAELHHRCTAIDKHVSGA